MSQEIYIITIDEIGEGHSYGIDVAAVYATTDRALAEKELCRLRVEGGSCGGRSIVKLPLNKPCHKQLAFYLE